MNYRPGFWSHPPVFPLATVKIVLPHAQPPTNSFGIFCSSTWLCPRAPGPSTDLGFQVGTWPDVDHTVDSSHKHQSAINALLLTTVMRRSWRGQERNEHGAPHPLSSPKGMYLFHGQRTAPEAVSQSQLPQC